MRCMNCGWENPDGLQKCEKCNSPLLAQRNQADIPQEQKDAPEMLRGTISEAQVFPETGKVFPNSGKACPKCGYPLRPELKKCPNCGAETAVDEKPAEQRVGNPVQANRKATVNPWANPVEEKLFSLEPIQWENEKHAPIKQEFSGEEVELNRDNTDPSNNSITSKVQAVITNEDGKWMIEDKSALNTTFVYAGKKIELEDGDIIMLGNRKFIFKAE